MFRIEKQAQGPDGGFVKLVHLNSDDFAVIVRHPGKGRLHQRYIGPDLTKAEEVFGEEAKKIVAPQD